VYESVTVYVFLTVCVFLMMYEPVTVLVYDFVTMVYDFVTVCEFV